MKSSSSHLLLRELSILLQSGLTLPRALEILSRQKTEVSSQILKLKKEIEEGRDLAQAFRGSGLFPDFVCEMLVAAYTGGGLEGILSRASELLARMEEFRNRVTSALIYPSLVIGFSFIAIIVVLEFIVPKLRKILLSFGRDLPFLTKVLLFGAKVFWWFLLLGLPLLGLAGVWWVKKKGWPEVHRALLGLPVVGKLWLYFDLSRWSYTTALLLDSGVVLPRAVSAGGNGCRNLFIRNSLKSLVRPLEEGESLSRHLRHYRFIPQVLTELSAIGEETGTLPEMLRNASDLLVKEADFLIERTLRWIEPLTVLFLGLIVAYLVISVILPIMEISSSVKL